MPRRSIALGEWETAAKVSSGKSAFKKGEILFGKLRPYFHKVGVAPVDGVCSTDILVFNPKVPDWFGFVLGHASSDAFVGYADQSIPQPMALTWAIALCPVGAMIPHDKIT